MVAIDKGEVTSVENAVTRGNSGTIAQEAAKPKTKKKKSRVLLEIFNETTDIDEERTDRLARRKLEHEAYLKRRASHMVHSNGGGTENERILLSRRCRYNMTKKRDDLPDHSPVKALDLRHTFRTAKLFKIVRRTREATTVLRFNIDKEA